MATQENSEEEKLNKTKNAVKGIQLGILSFWLVFITIVGIYIFNKVQQGNEISEYTMLITSLILLSAGILLPIYVLGRSVNRKNNS